jgi:alpha/beta superfamily hydrolase
MTTKTKTVVYQSRNETLTATLHSGQAPVKSPIAVILCPPHPLYGGNRNDARLSKVAEELAAHGITAMCTDYGTYGKGVKETQNVKDAVAYMHNQGCDRIGLFGYSFGSVVASSAAAQLDTRVSAYSAMAILRTVNGLKADLNFRAPKLFIHGRRDTIASYTQFEQLYEEAREPKQKLVLETDHFYMSNYPATIDQAAKTIRTFLQQALTLST